MLRGAFESAGELSVAELRSQYERHLVERIETAGLDAVAADADVDRETLSALVAGDRPDLTLADAAAILATDPERPDRDAIQAEARDILLMGMSMAVLDVEALSAGIDGNLEPKEIQQKVEGRAPMTLSEYATLHQYIEQEQR